VPLTSLNHVNIWTTRLTETIAFYEQALGLRVGFRPPAIKTPGAWIYDPTDTPVIHLMDAAAEGKDQQFGGGAIDHIAFDASDFEALSAHLTQLGLPFRTQMFPGMTLRQIFVDDPNGVTVELNFRGDDA
jgi:catechol 2,3-dioxygenase-like lactoylglutathione lyase family enzyme